MARIGWICLGLALLGFVTFLLSGVFDVLDKMEDPIGTLTRYLYERGFGGSGQSTEDPSGIVPSDGEVKTLGLRYSVILLAVGLLLLLVASVIHLVSRGSVRTIGSPRAGSEGDRRAFPLLFIDRCAAPAAAGAVVLVPTYLIAITAVLWNEHPSPFHGGSVHFWPTTTNGFFVAALLGVPAVYALGTLVCAREIDDALAEHLTLRVPPIKPPPEATVQPRAPKPVPLPILSDPDYRCTSTAQVLDGMVVSSRFGRRVTLPDGREVTIRGLAASLLTAAVLECQDDGFVTGRWNQSDDCGVAAAGPSNPGSRVDRARPSPHRSRRRLGSRCHSSRIREELGRHADA